MTIRTETDGFLSRPAGADLIGHWCDAPLRYLYGRASGDRMVDLVSRIVETDRRNSFDAFRETNRTLVRTCREAGLAAEMHPLTTGGVSGDGRWVIREAMDIRRASLEVVSPTERLLETYDENPWCVVHWSSSTPAGGIVAELCVADSSAELDRLAPRDVRGKFLLTRERPNGNLAKWARKGFAGVICSCEVPGLPEATLWGKFGWGGSPCGEGEYRLVGFMTSQAKGEELRALQAAGAPVRIRARLHARHYVGTHDAVSALIRGQEDPAAEVWAIAHGCEPGAVDNASGVAVSIEALRILREAIDGGALAPPRRTIRMLTAFECYGFFKYLAETSRLVPPLAGVCVDCVGVAPEHCDRTVKWHATVPSSAGFVDEPGFRLTEAAYALAGAGWQVRRAPFTSTEDTMIGDPRYGFPCPYLGSYPYRGYHSSADVPALLSRESLKASAAAVAAYLYCMAAVGTADVLTLGEAFAARLRAGEDGAAKRDLPEFAAARGAAAEGRIRSFLWEGERETVDHALGALRDGIPGVRASGIRDIDPDDAVPYRTGSLAPTYENVPADIAARFRRSGVHKWALYWADGKRTLSEIRRLASAEKGVDYSRDAIREFFSAMAAIGYVRLVPIKHLISREQLVDDLRRLGVVRGMDLMVHSSLRAIGFVQGGPDTVADALLEAIGPDGTLLMPSFNHGAADVFNPLTTPTTNGAVPEAFRHRDGVIRSLHPTHSVAGIGPKARRWCAGHLEAGIWAADSPIGKLIHEGGYILGLGVDHTSSTAYHVAEVAAGARCTDPFGATARVVMPDGAVARVRGLAWRETACPVSPRKLSETLDAEGLQVRGKVGNADCVLVRAKELFDVRCAHLRGICVSCPVRPKAANP